MLLDFALELVNDLLLLIDTFRKLGVIVAHLTSLLLDNQPLLLQPLQIIALALKLVLDGLLL